MKNEQHGWAQRWLGAAADQLDRLRSAVRPWWLRHGRGISIGAGGSIGRGVVVRAVAGGQVVIGKRVHLGDRARLVSDGGEIVIGDDGFVGPGTLVASAVAIRIGRDALIGEGVSLRDADHGTGPDEPYRGQPLVTAPVTIGNNVWIGAGARVLRGATIADDSIIAANAVVLSSSPVARGVRLGGVPARPLQRSPSAA